MYFLTRLTGELRQQELDLRAAQAARSHDEKMEALGTLAAGAAHELATPLTTIALVAKDVEQSILVITFEEVLLIELPADVFNRAFAIRSDREANLFSSRSERGDVTVVAAVQPQVAKARDLNGGRPLVHRGRTSAHSNTLGGVVLNVWDSELWNIADWYRMK